MENEKAAHLRRRALKRRGIKPRSLDEVLQPLQKAQFSNAPQPKFAEESIVKAKCSRLRGRTHVIRSTLFKFDTDGVCEVNLNEHPYAYRDFQYLLKMHGVEEIIEKAEKPIISAKKVIEADMTLNEARKELDLPALPGGDIPMKAPVAPTSPPPGVSLPSPEPKVVAKPEPNPESEAEKAEKQLDALLRPSKPQPKAIKPTAKTVVAKPKSEPKPKRAPRRKAKKKGDS
jgi:hypothetical protein